MTLVLKTNREKLLEQLTEIAFQLGRIADGIQILQETTNPALSWNCETPNDGDTVRAFYTDEDEEIVAAHLAKLGKKAKNSS